MKLFSGPGFGLFFFLFVCLVHMAIKYYIDTLSAHINKYRFFLFI